jgi:hypothetical protein
MANGDAAFHQREGFWLKAASWTFGLWALMIPITGKMILDGQKDIREAQTIMADRFQAYREVDQTAMAILKDRQDTILLRQRELQNDVQAIQKHIAAERGAGHQ